MHGAGLRRPSVSSCYGRQSECDTVAEALTTVVGHAVQAMRDMMEENYKKWHNHAEQQLAAHIQAAEDKAAANAEAQRRR